ncbi:MAG: PH domain-containing protein [Clostridia bacterium]|nr:PH domain-containing protein [Clostridia bacterium]
MIDFQNAEYLKLGKADISRASKAVGALLIQGENVIAAFKSVRDGVVFTTHRIIAFNMQGITGKKTDYTSLPYKRIQAFSVETSGVIDIDSELHIWLSGLGSVRFEFTRGTDIAALGRLIAEGSM